MVEVAIIATYAVGFVLTWFGATRYWLGRYGDDDVFEAGVWGFVAAVLWPIIVAGGAVGWLASGRGKW